MKNILNLVIWALVGAACLTVSQAKSADAMTEMLSGLSGDEFDAAFLQSMIAHHRDGVMMADLAVKKAKHEDLRMFAKKMASDQNSEISMMEGWMTEWKLPADTKHTMPKAMMEKMASEMKKLEQTEGDSFDREFLAIMPSHHEGAIAMAELVPQRSKRPEIVKLAEKIVQSQGKEVVILRKWNLQWFGGS